MLRPSERSEEKKLITFWSRYGNTVVPQYVILLKLLGYKEDVYILKRDALQSYPKCRLPFTSLDVNWNGDVPLCSLSGHQIGHPGLILGNVRTDRLSDIWNGKVMRQYREGHRTRDAFKMPICNGCIGG
jgi:MoaA/NifB/PqqE/SkfB family radical SAM enzyme